MDVERERPQMGSEIAVSVIIVTWNSADCIGQCLESIDRFSAPGTYEVIVVDNNSSDGTQALITERFPSVEVIQTGANLGFAPAANIGARAAQGRYLLLLNPDSRLDSDACAVLSSLLERHPEAGAVGPKLLGGNGAVIPYGARQFPTLRDSVLMHLGLRGHVWPHSPQLGRPVKAAGGDVYEVPMLSGAAMMIGRSLFLELGGFDELLPMYFDDLALCKRVGLTGRKLYYCPVASVVHMDHLSTQKSTQKSILHAMQKGHSVWLYFRTFRGQGAANAFVAITVMGGAYRVALFSVLVAATWLTRGGLHSAARRKLSESVALLRWALGSKSQFERRVWKAFESKPEFHTMPRGSCLEG